LSNTDSDVFLATATHAYYVLLAGRWYTSPKLDEGKWSFVASDKLPEAFAHIPGDSPRASVRWVSTHMPMTITMWGRNLTGAEYHTFGTALNFGPVGGPGAPRTYGATFGYKF